MQIFWSEKQIPELANLPDSQRRKVVRECGALWEWDSVVVGLGALLTLVLIGLGNWFGHQLNLERWAIAACAASGFVVGLVISLQIAFQRLRGRVRRYLTNHADELKTVSQ